MFMPQHASAAADITSTSRLLEVAEKGPHNEGLDVTGGSMYDHS